MMRELQDLERAHPKCRPNSPSVRVGSDITRSSEREAPVPDAFARQHLFAGRLHEFIARIEGGRATNSSAN
ncbi:MAG: hypothetical protein ACLT1W_15030 [Alistipes onderdonkii]